VAAYLELLVGAVLSTLVFLFYLFVCLLLPAAISLLITSRLPLVGRQTDSWWLRLRKRLGPRR
jgi:hypothetical protein